MVLGMVKPPSFRAPRCTSNERNLCESLPISRPGPGKLLLILDFRLLKASAGSALEAQLVYGHLAVLLQLLLY